MKTGTVSSKIKTVDLKDLKGIVKSKKEKSASIKEMKQSVYNAVRRKIK